MDTPLKRLYSSKDFLARSRDLSHIEDLQKPPCNPKSQGGKYRREGGRQRELSCNTHTWRETENTHRRRADCGSKLAQLSSPPHCSQMAFTLAEGERVLSNISSAWLAKSTGSRSLWARRTRLCCAQPRSGLRDGEKGTDMG